MKAGNGARFEQAYNTQPGVEVDSRIITAGQFVAAPNYKQELTPPPLGTLAPVIESVGAVLIDSGFYSEAIVKAADGTENGALAGVQVFAATERHKHGRRIADLEIKAESAQLPADALFIEQMRRRLQTSQGRQAYDQRKSTVEPVFGIIKEAMGFRRFCLRHCPANVARVGKTVEWADDPQLSNRRE
jgi:hypothetical protein